MKTDQNTVQYVDRTIELISKHTVTSHCKCNKKKSNKYIWFDNPNMKSVFHIFLETDTMCFSGKHNIYIDTVLLLNVGLLSQTVHQH